MGGFFSERSGRRENLKAIMGSNPAKREQRSFLPPGRVHRMVRAVAVREVRVTGTAEKSGG
jgi:hypothetical protein